MSEFAEAVRAAVTEDWLTTTEIMMKVPAGRRVNSPRSHVYKHLYNLARSGIVEHEARMTPHGPRAYWRLRA